jgi:hypothetical protein
MRVLAGAALDSPAAGKQDKAQCSRVAGRRTRWFSYPGLRPVSTRLGVILTVAQPLSEGHSMQRVILVASKQRST